MFELEALLTDSPLLPLLLGALTGAVVFDLRARGAGAWARNAFGVVAVTAFAASAAYFLTLYSSEIGWGLLIQTTVGSAASVWIVFGLVALWRNNILIATVLDPRFLGLLVALLLAGGGVYLMVYGSSHPMRDWSYAAVPVVAGALHRLILVLAFERLSLPARESRGRRIDRRLMGLDDDGGGGGGPVLFDPLGGRSAAQALDEDGGLVATARGWVARLRGED